MNIKEEFALKRKRLEQVMDRHGLGALAIRRLDNFAWLSCGGNGAVTTVSEMACGTLVATRDGRDFLVADVIEADRLLAEQNLGELGFEALTHPWDENPADALIAEKVGSSHALCGDFSHNAWKDVSKEIAACRARLTPSERERYLFLGKRLSEAVEAAIGALRPGISEGEATGVIASALWEDRIDLVTYLVAFDERIRLYRHPVTVNRRLEKTALVSVNARYRGLIATVTRMAHIGPLDPAFHRQYVDTVAVECKMINKTVPGARDRDVLQTAVDAYAALGFPGEEKKHHQGGSMGYQPRDSIATPASTGTVLPGQAYCWNPTITGTKSEDGFIVGETGPEFITGPVACPTITVEADGVSFVRPDITVI